MFASFPAFVVRPGLAARRRRRRVAVAGAVVVAAALAVAHLVGGRAPDAFGGAAASAGRAAWSRRAPPPTLAATGLYADVAAAILAPGVRTDTPRTRCGPTAPARRGSSRCRPAPRSMRVTRTRGRSRWARGRGRSSRSSDASRRATSSAPPTAGSRRRTWGTRPGPTRCSRPSTVCAGRRGASPACPTTCRAAPTAARATTDARRRCSACLRCRCPPTATRSRRTRSRCAPTTSISTRSCGRGSSWGCRTRCARAGLASATASVVGHASRVRVPTARGVADVRVVPGDPEASVLWRRITSRDPRLQMSPLGRRVVDVEGAALVEAWIREDLAPPATAPSEVPSPLVKENVR